MLETPCEEMGNIQNPRTYRHINFLPIKDVHMWDIGTK